MCLLLWEFSLEFGVEWGWKYHLNSWQWFCDLYLLHLLLLRLLLFFGLALNMHKKKENKKKSEQWSSSVCKWRYRNLGFAQYFSSAELVYGTHNFSNVRVLFKVRFYLYDLHVQWGLYTLKQHCFLDSPLHCFISWWIMVCSPKPQGLWQDKVLGLWNLKPYHQIFQMKCLFNSWLYNNNFTWWFKAFFIVEVF